MEYKIQKTFSTTCFFFKKISWAPPEITQNASAARSSYVSAARSSRAISAPCQRSPEQPCHLSNSSTMSAMSAQPHVSSRILAPCQPCQRSPEQPRHLSSSSTFMYTGVHCCVGWRHSRFENAFEIFSFLSLVFHDFLSFLIYCVYCVYYVYSSVRSKGERQDGIQNPKNL